VNQITPKRLTNSGLSFVKAFKACCLFIKFSRFRTHHQKIKKSPIAQPLKHLPLRTSPCAPSPAAHQSSLSLPQK
jgi:hypothetical protein